MNTNVECSQEAEQPRNRRVADRGRHHQRDDQFHHVIPAGQKFFAGFEQLVKSGGQDRRDRKQE